MPDCVEKEKITACLPPCLAGISIDVIEETTSTNDVLKQRARRDGLRDFTCLLAKRQTAGRGRQGKGFYSPEGGVYLSVYISSCREAFDFATVTIRAAVAARAAIAAMGTPCGIKWVNDIYVKGRKVCGILCERVDDNGYICGIGINVGGEIPPELEGIAGTLPDSLDRSRLAAEVIGSLHRMAGEPFEQVLAQYRGHSILIGRAVKIIRAGQPDTVAVAEGIGADGGLTVRLADGTCTTLIAGEVSLKI